MTQSDEFAKAIAAGVVRQLRPLLMSDERSYTMYEIAQLPPDEMKAALKKLREGR